MILKMLEMKFIKMHFLNNQISNLNNIMIQEFSKTNDELKTKMQE